MNSENAYHAEIFPEGKKQLEELRVAVSQKEALMQQLAREIDQLSCEIERLEKERSKLIDASTKLSIADCLYG